MNDMKVESYWLRPAVCFLVMVKGYLQKDVAEMFGVRPNMISDAIKRYKETGTHENRPGQGGKRTARTEENIDQVRTMLDENNRNKRIDDVPGNSTRKIALELDISEPSARRILKDDLQLTPWKLTKGQKLTDLQKEQRLIRSMALKTRFSYGRHRQILFSDEKLFTIQESYNPQNDRIWSAEKPSAADRVVERQMKPKGVMVWMGVGYDAKAPLIFISTGVKINTDVYRKEVLEPVKDWAIDHYGVDEEDYWNNWTFQQDGAPAHTSVNDNSPTFEISTQTWLRNNFPDFIDKYQWPAVSPDLNPLDYCIWSVIEADVNAQAHASVESLRLAIEEAFDNLSQETINNSVDNWMKRLDKVIEVQGGHFE